jgi:peptide/nickel transport system substrate-binding protein
MHLVSRLTRLFAILFGLAALAPVPAALAAGNIIVGTTDTVAHLDPAVCYSFYCANVLHNVGQTLVTYPADSTQLKSELAKSMPKVSDDGLTYTFKVHKGVKFQNGSKLTSKDVKFSLDRCMWMNDPQGAGFLLSSIKNIKTPDPYTVVIHLKAPDNTFVSKLAFTEATIVPSDAYPSPKKPLPDSASLSEHKKYRQQKLIGSGPYKVARFSTNQSMLLTTWDGYWGKQPANDKVLIRFYAKNSQMLAALKSGEIDVAFRHFTPDQRKSLANSPNIKTIKGSGQAIRYLVFNPYLKPTKSRKVRRAIAAALDRKRIIKDVFGGAAQPLYSMIPPGFKKAYKPDFKTRYGDKKASDYLDHKVDLTLWYSRGHYGNTETAFAQTIKRILNNTGLFNVTTKAAEWAQFTAHAYPGKSGQYAAFLLGWYPDYLDPDDYVMPFYSSNESFLRMYNNKQMDKLIKKERTVSGSSKKAKRMQAFAKIQKLAARDTPIVPLFVLTPYAFARKDISGVAKTMGPAQIFRYSVLSKQGS